MNCDEKYILVRHIKDAQNERDAVSVLDAVLSERYVELPVDADGAPIHVDDWLEYDYGDDIRGKHQVVALILTDRWDYEFDDNDEDTRCVARMDDFYRCNRHCGPRTVEDVLERFIRAYDDWDENAGGDRLKARDELFSYFAEELRAVGGVE